MAATALSITSPTPKPPLVASRRIEFRIAQNSFSRWKYSQIDCFVANSGAIRDRLVGDGIPRTKITIVNEGVDVERIVRMPAGNVHAPFYLPTHSPVVGNVAALVPHKGQQHLIDAAALVVRDVPDARFVIVGDGELREALERHIKEKHLERHVFLAGFRADALELTKGFDLFAMSSVSEGMCTALVDAMAASKAAVATTAGGIPEVMVDGETGFLVPPRDHHAMAEKLVLLLKDEGLRARMGEAALRRARERFTVERMVEGTAAVYARLLTGSRTGAGS
jgi:glycosyltransferase involved in cell wall biosynthesis